MEIKENDIVMCTVEKIEGTTVFVKIEEGPSGSIVFSEIAAGRIRNIREYVHQGKKIVCKVLKISTNHIELSLRRVTGKEREEIQDRYKKQKIMENMLKAVSPDYQNVIAKIKQNSELWAFFDQVKENPSVLEKYLKKTEYEPFIKSLAEKEGKEKIVKRTISLKSETESGLSDIKEILQNKKVTVHYIGSSLFMIESRAKDYKVAENTLNEAITMIEAKAKEKKAIFELKEKP